MMFAILAFAGAIGGGLFWLIRRPDRDTKRSLDATAKPDDLTAHEQHN